MVVTTRMTVERIGGTPNEPPLWAAFSLCDCCDGAELLAFGYATAQEVHDAALRQVKVRIEREYGGMSAQLLGSEIEDGWQ